MATGIQGVALLTALLAGCGHTIRPGETGLKYRALHSPALQDEELPDGFYFQWAWNDIEVYDVTWQSHDIDVDVLTKDDLHVPITLTVTYRPQAGHIRELHTTVGPNYYSEVIEPALATLVREAFAAYPHNQLAAKSLAIEDAIVAQLRERVAGKPLDIDSVAIKHIRYDPAVTASISQKLVKQQQSEQKQFEITIAQQDAEIARTYAQGQSDSIRIQAEGEAAAIVTKGQAQAEAQADITKTLTRSYLQYKAFDNPSTTYYFAPIGRDGLPVLVGK